ncbi:hypothetical protein CU254_28505 [Amycolatopsis sp. AA4]|nr:hypothetical protein CU254_28505 [Amycolatopsis sp. AA4]
MALGAWDAPNATLGASDATNVALGRSPAKRIPRRPIAGPSSRAADRSPRCLADATGKASNPGRSPGRAPC